MSRTPTSLAALIAQSTDLLLQQDKEGFQLIHNQIVSASEFDELTGGVFDDSSPLLKSLATNVQLALVYITAANTFADADYAKTALLTINHLIHNHRTEQGLYSEQTSYDLTSIDVNTIKSILDNSQWLALKTYFGLNDSEEIVWHLLYRKMPLSDLPLQSGLHRKQAPLALDGATQILQQFIPPPHQSNTYQLSSNLELCACLWLSALYLNQPSHAEAATHLVDRLKAKESINEESLWTLVLLLRLSYEWSDNDFELLSKIPQADTFIPTDILASHVNKQSQIGWTINDEKPANLLTSLISNCETVVVIEGPAFAIRQWLQMTNNYFNPKLWVFAKPSDSPAQATLYRNNGSVEVITNMNELVDLIGQTYHPSALLG